MAIGAWSRGVGGGGKRNGCTSERTYPLLHHHHQRARQHARKPPPSLPLSLSLSLHQPLKAPLPPLSARAPAAGSAGRSRRRSAARPRPSPCPAAQRRGARGGLAAFDAAQHPRKRRQRIGPRHAPPPRKAERRDSGLCSDNGPRARPTGAWSRLAGRGRQRTGETAPRARRGGAAGGPRRRPAA